MHQGADRSGKRSPPEAHEHLSEAVLHHILENQIRIPRKRGNAAMGT
jgi:hypothetical protein